MPLLHVSSSSTLSTLVASWFSGFMIYEHTEQLNHIIMPPNTSMTSITTLHITSLFRMPRSYTSSHQYLITYLYTVTHPPARHILTPFLASSNTIYHTFLSLPSHHTLLSLPPKAEGEASDLRISRVLFYVPCWKDESTSYCLGWMPALPPQQKQRIDAIND